MSVASGSRVPKVAGTEKRRATATRPVKSESLCRSAAVSLPLPSMQMPVSARTRSLRGARTLPRQGSRDAAETRILSRLDARCPAKSLCRTMRHSRDGRPPAGSSRSPRRLSGPMKEALHTTTCAPQAPRTAARDSAERRSVSTSSRRGAPRSCGPSCATRGPSACHLRSEAADLSAGKDTARPRSDRSARRPPGRAPGPPSAPSSAAQPGSPRSATTVCTDGQWTPATTPRAASGDRSAATPLRWCTRRAESQGHESCEAVAMDAPNHRRASCACRNGSTRSAVSRPKDEEAKLRWSNSRASRRRCRAWCLHCACSWKMCSLSSLARLPSSSSR
mmetsp:Transcript_50345/g.146051  ORF Transcript_50345/g.146051 Transcript_50345/m.146051 type:complete len:335 (+) Transcript_50345:409-1413(+)